MVFGGFSISIPILFPLNIWLNNGRQGIGACWGNIAFWPLDMDATRIWVQNLIRRPFSFEERNRSRKQLPKANKGARDVGCYNRTIVFKKCKTQVYISIAIYIYISTCLSFIAVFFPGHPTHLWTCGKNHPEILLRKKTPKTVPMHQLPWFPSPSTETPKMEEAMASHMEFKLLHELHRLRASRKPCTWPQWCLKKGGRDWCADL